MKSPVSVVRPYLPNGQFIAACPCCRLTRPHARGATLCVHCDIAANRFVLGASLFAGLVQR